jgi:plasmid stabilization system protein ParE
MPTRSTVIHPLAGQEMRASYRWYARRSQAAAQRFEAALEDVVQRIVLWAEQGAPYRQQYRWMRLPRFPYLLFYEVRDPQPVLIYALAHVRRRSGYWLRRTRP